MSDPKVFGIDQYAVWTHNLNGPINPLGSLATSEDESMKIVVTYADHVEALRQAEQRGYELGRTDGILLGQERAHRDSVIVHEGAAERRGYVKGQRDALADAVQRVEALPWEVAVSFGPIDCNYSCEEGPCTCSGDMRPEAWRTGPAAVIAAIKGVQP